MPAIFEPIRAPGLQEGTWLNSPPLTMADLRGRVVLVDFWDYASLNCLRTLPYLQAWQRRYAALDFTVVGVHAPQYAFGRDEAHVRRAVERLGIDYPVLLDTAHRTWVGWMNRFWPTKYLIDPEGQIRYFHYGEGDYLGLEAQIQIMIRAQHPDAELPPMLLPLRAGDEPGVTCYRSTPDTQLGFRRGLLGNLEGHQPNQVVDYEEPEALQQDMAYLAGAWLNTPEAVVAAEPDTRLAVRYQARDVYLVLAPPEGHEGLLAVEQDDDLLPQAALGEDVAREGDADLVTVEMPRVYHLVQNPAFGTHDLRLRVLTPGLAVYALNFVSEVIADAADEAA